MTSPRKVGARQKKKIKKNKDQFSIKTSGIEILLNKGTQQDKHLVNCSSPFKYTCYVKVQILTVKFGKSVIFWVKVFQISLCHTKMVSITNISNHNKYRNQRQNSENFEMNATEDDKETCVIFLLGWQERSVYVIVLTTITTLSLSLALFCVVRTSSHLPCIWHGCRRLSRHWWHPPLFFHYWVWKSKNIFLNFL